MKYSLVCLFLLVNIILDEVTLSYTSRLLCPAVTIKNGKVRRRQRGRFLKFLCNQGYLLAGERHSTCLHGMWDPAPPKCVRPTCPNRVQPPNNGLIYPSHSGAALHFFCKSGYILKGPSDVFCDGRVWDNNAPVCLTSGTKPKLFCDFEEEDICDWTHDLNHDFDWRRENYNTPSGSIGTGPSFDHTKGIGEDGYYMYIESSMRNENDTAKLISPIYDKMDGEICFEFFYHMFGATTGTLRVYLKKTSQNDWNLDPNSAIFSKSGNQGDKWYRSFHRLGVINDDFQIIIEGIRGSGYVSDIAIDDVKIIPNCTQEEEDQTTTEGTTANTEMIQIVDSCDQRCGLKEPITHNSYHLTCDCDENCYDNNRCCPDYYDYCVLVTGSTLLDESTTTTEMSNDINFNNIRTTATSKPLYSSTTTSFTSVSRSFLSKSSPVPTTTKAIVPTVKPYVTIITKTTTNISPTTTTTTKRPIISFKPAPTTSLILRKTKPTFPSSTWKSHLGNESSIEMNDIVEVTPKQNNDEALFLNSLPHNDVTKEYFPEDDDISIESPYFGNFSESNKLLSQTSPGLKDYNIVLIVISVAGIVVLVSVITVVIIRRHSCQRRRSRFGNGDSQSDVRFLTHDELIDFSLAV